MDIVLFTPQDQEEVGEFMKNIFKEMGWVPRSDEGLDDLKDFFHIPDEGFLLLVRENGKVVGTGGVTKIDVTTGLIKRVYIGKELRNGGIGSKLMEKLIQTAKEFDISRLVLDVDRNSKAAIHVYEKIGFKAYNQSQHQNWPESYEPDTHYFYFLEI